MPEYQVAGHTFAGTCDDVCTGKLENGQPCHMTWARLSTATIDNVKEEGWAHTSYLSSHELGQIEAEIKRRAEVAERMWAAVMDLGTPG